MVEKLSEEKCDEIEETHEENVKVLGNRNAVLCPEGCGGLLMEKDIGGYVDSQPVSMDTSATIVTCENDKFGCERHIPHTDRENYAYTVALEKARLIH